MLSTRNPVQWKLIGLATYRPFMSPSTNFLLVDLVGASISAHPGMPSGNPQIDTLSEPPIYRSSSATAEDERGYSSRSSRSDAQRHSFNSLYVAEAGSRASQCENSNRLLGTTLLWRAGGELVPRCLETGLAPPCFAHHLRLHCRGQRSPYWKKLPLYTSPASSIAPALRLQPRSRWRKKLS